MKWSHGVGLASVLLSVGTASWAGCGGDDTTATPGGDAGADALVTPDAGATGNDGGTTGNDAGGNGDDGGSTDAGLSCEVYCTQVMANCTGAPFPAGKAAVDGGNQQYTTKQGCLHECAKTPVGAITDTQGDTVGCRQYHSGAPAKADAKLHCPHAGPSGGGMCSGGDAGTESRCFTFCDRALALCNADAGLPAGDVPFASLAECEGKCKNAPYTFDPTKLELLTNGNDLNCRQYHLEAAYENPPGTAMTHCQHLKNPSATCN